MKQKITSEQRILINQLLDRGENRSTIAQLASVTPGQVSALAAHRTMRKNRDVAKRALDIEISGNQAVNTVSYSSPEAASHSVTIPLGINNETEEPVIWNPYSSINPHVLILGESGSGKTYTASRLVIELANSDVPSIVLDYGQGYSLQDVPAAYRKGLKVINLHLSRDGIAINPLQIFPVDIHGPSTVAQRVADTFARVYSRLGVQQHTILRRATLELLADAGILTTDPRTWTKSPPPFRDLEQKLKEYSDADDTLTRRAAASAASHISTLFFFNTFRKTGHAISWSDILTRRNEIWILQLGGLEASVERAVTEFLLWSLMRYFELLGPGPLRCYTVLDEAHKLTFGPGSPVEQILREGRKFGLGVVLASQQPEDFSSVAFANTAAKIILQIADQSGHVARQLHRKIRNGHSLNYIASTLGTLPRGWAYVLQANTGYTTRLLSFEERELKGHNQKVL